MPKRHAGRDVEGAVPIAEMAGVHRIVRLAATGPINDECIRGRLLRPDTWTIASRKTPTLVGTPTRLAMGSKTRTLVSHRGPETVCVSLAVNPFSTSPDSSPASADSSR